MFRVVENVRRKHLDWVNSILASTGWSQHRLAKEADLSPSALNKFLKDPTDTRTLNSFSLEKLERASGIPLSRGTGAFTEAETPGYEVERIDDLGTMAQAMKQGRNGVDAWRMKTRALELAGYIPGDTLIVDQGVTPQMGDVVIAQIYDRNGEAETVVRIFEGSFLIAATTDPALISPIFINKDVLIRGVCIASTRNRRAA
jgi:SOS-response transcriptional repressor LexA